MADRTIAIASTPPGATVEINGPTPDHWWSRTANAGGYAPFQIDDTLGDSAIRITAQGYAPYLVPFHFHTVSDPQHWGTPMNQQVNVGLQIPAMTSIKMPRPWATSHGLVTDDGQPFVWSGADSYRLHERVVLGESVEDHLNQLQDCGVNVVRILMDAAWFRFKSWERPETYELMQATASTLARRRMYGQWCCFADWHEVWNSELDRARAHLVRVDEQLRTLPNLIGQLVNEGNQHGQNFPYTSFALPDNILFSIGSKGTGEDPPSPELARGRRDRYNSFGAERVASRYPLNTTTVWYAVNGYEGDAGAPGFDGTQWPTVCDEPPNIGEDYGYGPDVARLLGAGCRWDPMGRACGGNAHFTAGKQSLPASAYDLACVRAFVQGVKSL